MGRSTVKGDRTREALIEAAFELFGRQGYHATTMRQIADRAGLTPGSIYNHFAGKDEIFLAVLKTYHPLNKIAPLLARASGETTSQYIVQSANHVARAMEEQPGLLNLALIEMVELEGQHLPALIESFRPQVMDFAHRLQANDGQLRVSPIRAFRVFLGLLIAYELTDRLLQTALGAEAGDAGGLDDFVDVYLHGILHSGGNDEESHEHD